MTRQLQPEDKERLDRLFGELCHERELFTGYPCAADFDFRELFRFLELPINNVGDPFKDGTYRVHTHELEREVVEWFAHLCHAPKDSWWGYVTNGGTEGNMYGLYLARELMPEGVCYYSQDTHYSVAKMLRVLKMQNIMIKSQPSGEMDYEDLRESIRIHRDTPPIIFANIGTTMREGIDDIRQIRQILREFAIPNSYIHCDAALSGITLSFQEGAPVFDFREKVDSISISGHKFLGSPIPCGIVLANKNNVQRIARNIEYVGSLDTTISGSRNGITPLFLWYVIHRQGAEGIRKRVERSLQTAEYAVRRFREIGVEAWRNPFAITVVIPRPAESVVRKWQIAVNDDIGHLVVMPHLTRAQIDALVTEVSSTKS